MEKLSKYIIRNRRNAQRANRSFCRKVRRKNKHKGITIVRNTHNNFSNQKTDFTFTPIKFAPLICAPIDFRLIENMDDCLKFFAQIQDPKCLNKYYSQRFVKISLASIQKIDYASICVLMALCNDLNMRHIGVRGILPREKNCFHIIAESGFLQHVVDFDGKKYDIATSSQLIFFERSTSVLSEQDSQKISLLIRQIVKYLSGNEKPCMGLKTLILEICGNSLEWSKVNQSHWLLGVVYKENNRVIFTTTDIGMGILRSLIKKFTRQYFDNFVKGSDKILKGAFSQKYGSNTQEENRNNGLPYIRDVFERGGIVNLKCLTNDAYLDFSDESNSRQLQGTSFRGTFYQWEIDLNCLTKI